MKPATSGLLRGLGRHWRSAAGLVQECARCGFLDEPCMAAGWGLACVHGGHRQRGVPSWVGTGTEVCCAVALFTMN